MNKKSKHLRKRSLPYNIEGRERKAVYFANRRFDRLNYAILAEDYRKA